MWVTVIAALSCSKELDTQANGRSKTLPFQYIYIYALIEDAPILEQGHPGTKKSSFWAFWASDVPSAMSL